MIILYFVSWLTHSPPYKSIWIQIRNYETLTLLRLLTHKSFKITPKNDIFTKCQKLNISMKNVKPYVFMFAT